MKLAITSLGVTASLALGACYAPYFSWSPREPLSARRGHVAVVVEDHRAGDAQVVGTAFSFGGVPRSIRLREGEVSESLHELVREAAITAGLGLAPSNDPPSAKLVLGVDTLACDGRGLVAHADMQVAFSVVAPDGSVRVPAETIALRGKGPGCERAFAETFDRLLDELASRLVDGPAHEAAL